MCVLQRNPVSMGNGASAPVGDPALITIADRLDRLPVSRWHRAITAMIGLGSFFNFFEVALSSSLGVLLGAEWSVTTVGRALIIGSLFAGEMVGSLLLARYADRLGRRPLFQINLLVYAGLSVATAFAPNLAVFLILRLLSGVGLGAELTLVDTYLSELLPSAHRARYIAWSYTLGMVAFPVAAGLATAAKYPILGIAGWRWLLALAACGGLVVWLVRRRLPESPRWLAATGDFTEADAVLTAIEHKVYRQTGENAEPHGEEPAPATLSTARPPSSREYRPRRLLMWLMWTLQPVGFYGFASIVPIVVLAKGFDLTHSLAYAALSALGYPLGSLVSVFLTERVERRAMLIASTIAAAVFGVSFGLAATPSLIIAFGIATTISTVIQSNIIHTYQAELFHTANRSSAIGLPYAASRLVSALLPLAALPLLAAAGPTGLYVCCALLLVAMAVAVRILGPRIKKQQLDTI